MPRQFKIYDVEAALASCQIDAAADSKWFDEHPGVKTRNREPSPLEIKAQRLPLGSRVLVFRLSDGTQGRAFMVPEGAE